MTFTPVVTFNKSAAKSAYDLVMKMDDEEAEVFVDYVIHDMLEQDITKHLRPLQSHLNAVVSKRVENVKKAAVRAAVGDPEAARPYAAAIAQFSKAQENPYDRGYRFRESDFRRNAGTGRFEAKVHTSTNAKPMHDRQAASMGLPNSTHRTASKKSLNKKELANYQEQYQQLANFLGAVNDSSVNPGDHDVLAHVRIKSNGRDYTVAVNSTKPEHNLWNPKTEDLVGLTARPNALTLGGAYFGLSTALGQPDSMQAMGGRVRGLNGLDAGAAGFADDWTQDGDPRNSTTQVYNRISSGSKLAQQMSPPGSKTMAAARLAQFVGDHGSDAESVFGPTARKTAYRYRGTSKTPDHDMVLQYNGANRTTMARNNFDAEQRTKIRTAQTRAVNGFRASEADRLNKPIESIRISDTKRAELMNTAAAKYRHSQRQKGLNLEQRGAGRTVVLEHLRNKMPNRGLYGLQLASGNTPPSEGVIINSAGKITNQSIGYGDDHYLPFNLKNLKDLKGGEYIRTRSVGGLTSEDIYTGLMSGARQVTVTSRSGTFTMTFEQDFTGKRRHNDKAQRMTKRYQSILDAVQSQQVDRMDVDPATRAGIRAQVQKELGGYANPKEMNTEVQRRIQEFKDSPDMSGTDELANTMVALQTGGGQSADAAKVKGQIMNQLAAEKEYKFRLNGMGYAAALDALAEQFPYYIKVNSNPTQDPERVETELDRGYVEPGRNRPSYASAGLFGGAATARYSTQGAKFSAAEANYQSRRAPTRIAAPVATPASGGATPDLKNKAQDIRAQGAEMKQRIAYAQAAKGIQDHVKAIGIQGASPEDQAALDYTAQDLRDPAKQKAFDAFVGRLQASKANLGVAGTNYKIAAGHVGSTPFTTDVAGIYPDKPYGFTGDGYGAGAKVADKKKALAEIDKQSRSAVTQDKKLSDLTTDELAKEHAALVTMKLISDTAHDQGMVDPKVRAELMADAGVRRGAPGMDVLLANPKAIDKAMENVHRVRALKEGMPAQEPGDITIHSAGADPDERSKARTQAAANADYLDSAASYFADAGDDDMADKLTLAAHEFREGSRTFNGLADHKAVVDMYSSEVAMAMRVNHEKNKRGPNGTLRYTA